MTDKSLTKSLPVAANERSRVLAAARSDIELVRRHRAEIAQSFFEIGKALARLRVDPIPKLLGFGTFARLCREALAISPSRAAKLLVIAERVAPRDALRWGPEKAAAIVDLANAAGENGHITRKALPVDPEHMTVREIRQEARKHRSRVGRRSGRGKAVTTEERLIAQRIEEALHAAGVTTARVVAMAAPPGKPSYLRIDRIPVDAIRTFRKSLAAAA